MQERPISSCCLALAAGWWSTETFTFIPVCVAFVFTCLMFCRIFDKYFYCKSLLGKNDRPPEPSPCSSATKLIPPSFTHQPSGRLCELYDHCTLLSITSVGAAGLKRPPGRGARLSRQHIILGFAAFMSPIQERMWSGPPRPMQIADGLHTALLRCCVTISSVSDEAIFW